MIRQRNSTQAIFINPFSAMTVSAAQSVVEGTDCTICVRFGMTPVTKGGAGHV